MIKLKDKGRHEVQIHEFPHMEETCLFVFCIEKADRQSDKKNEKKTLYVKIPMTADD